MTEAELLARIEVHPNILSGEPIIRGLRIAVEHVLGMLAAGDTPERILQEYPFLEPEDIQACLLLYKTFRLYPGAGCRGWPAPSPGGLFSRACALSRKNRVDHFIDRAL